MSDIRLTVTVDASVTDVFAALTEPRLLELWIAAEATVDLRADGTYDFGWRGGGPAKIRSVERNRVLEYVWRFGDEPETVVRWDIADVDGMSRITLVHNGFQKASTRDRYEQGWMQRLRHLEAVASAARPVAVLRITSDETILPQAHQLIEKEAPMQIGNISLNTDDLEANRRFYVEFLRLPVKREHPKMLALDGNLVIDAGHGNPSTWSAHIMLLADDLSVVESRANEFGYPCGRFPSGNLALRDPDGRMVEIMRRQDWSNAAWQKMGNSGGRIDFPGE